ncbi:MAG: hypothetical protein GY762_04740 [Proteobacteria bacterium]|nr:hypothetical protein [Pseudomonadota bacterium]
MKGIDLFLGVKTEQTLRDATRAAEGEAPAGDKPSTELCPIGKKDWIAGERIGLALKFKEINDRRRRVIKDLLQLNSHQRIRQENIRLYAVRKPVPVFKDPVPDDIAHEMLADKAESVPGPASETRECPVCGARVHNFNMQYDPWGRAVGCYLCRGEPSIK